MIGLRSYLVSYRDESRALVASVEAMEVRVSMRFGAFVRTAAQRSMRSGGKKRKASSPGEPPRAHGRRLLRKFLVFDVDTRSRTVVVGPKLLNQLDYKGGGILQRGTVPETLEYGGSYIRHEYRKPRDLVLWQHARGKSLDTDPDRDWHRVDRRFRSSRYAGAETRWRTIAIKPRPYMAPALARERPKFATLFKDQLRKVAA